MRERPGAEDRDEASRAREICLRLLTGAPRTRAQLGAQLARRGVDEEIAERVLARLTDVGLVDDLAFARAWVESRHAGRGLARPALARELRARGVDGELVREAVDQLDDADERETARALVARRLPATRGLPREVRMRRLAGQLARRGYSAGVALAVIGEALREEGADGPGGGPDDDLDGVGGGWL